MEVLKGAVISDVHIGAIPAKKLKKELVNSFFNKIKERNDLNLVVINGDLFDHKLSFNSEDSKLGIDFINNLLSLANKKNFIIRLIKGTKNHDNDQLNNFLYLEKKYKEKFKIINHVSTEIIYDKFKILYLPEEYVESIDYYNDYLNTNEKYDLVFGHGTFSHVGYVSSNQESERPIKDAITFNYTQFKDIVKGFVMFGHVHEANEYKNIYYTGSFSRWAFNEEKDKGFYFFDYNYKGKYELEFIKNELADKYISVNINSILQDEFLSSSEKLEAIKKMNSNKQKIRIIFDNELLDKCIDSNILKEYFGKEKNVKIKIENKEKTKKLEEEDKIRKEYEFLFDENMNIESIISRYLQKHNNINLSEDVIKELLFEEN